MSDEKPGEKKPGAGDCETASPTGKVWPKMCDGEYRARDLALKAEAVGFQRCSYYIALTSLLVSIVGFGAVILSLTVNTWQAALNTQQLAVNYEQQTNNALQLKNNTQQSMTKLTMDLDRVVFDHPELVPYLEGAENPEGSTNKARAVEAAIMMLDVFDVAAAQTGTFKAQWSDARGWTNWVADDFARSPFLRQQYMQYTNWYGTNMTYLVNHLNNPQPFAPTNHEATNGVVGAGRARMED